jgi:broad specificity phosphatase PhoE
MVNYTSIIATHQARIRCLLSKMFDKKFERFKNGAIIRLDIESNPIREVNISLVYEGDLGDDENNPSKKYYVNNDSNIGEQQRYTGEKFRDMTYTDDENKLNIEINNNTYTFFLIRHGQGTHNPLKGRVKRVRQFKPGSLYKDPELTEIGKEQAKNTGKLKLMSNSNTDLKTNLKSANFFFCSDLIRTIQTIAYFLSELHEGENLNDKEIIVLPCAHELTYKNKKNGKCDGTQRLNTNENLPSQMPDKINIQKNEFRINWKTYTNFYNHNKGRMATVRNPFRKRCSNTNFIKEAIEYIEKNKSEVKKSKSSGESEVKKSKSSGESEVKKSKLNGESKVKKSNSSGGKTLKKRNNKKKTKNNHKKKNLKHKNTIKIR